MKNGNTLLIMAVMAQLDDIVEILLYHAYVHARSDKNRTSLMIAAMDGYQNGVSPLLDCGADINQTTSKDMSPLC